MQHLGSPFMVEVSDPGKIHPLEVGMTRVALGKPASVSIDPRRAANLAENAVVEVIGEY